MTRNPSCAPPAEQVTGWPERRDPQPDRPVSGAVLARVAALSVRFNSGGMAFFLFCKVRVDDRAIAGQGDTLDDLIIPVDRKISVLVDH